MIRKGSAYIYVMVIGTFFVTAILISFDLVNSKNEIYTNKNSIAMYPLTVDALEVVVDRCNELITSEVDYNRFYRYLGKNKPINTNNAIYVKGTNNYDGEFILNNNEVNKVYKQLVDVTWNKFTDNNYRIQYNVEDTSSYDVEVVIDKDFHNDYYAIADVKNLTSNISTSYQSKLEFISTNSFKPIFQYKEIPYFVTNGINIVDSSDVDGYNYVEELNMNLPQNEFSIGNPIVICDDRTIDISNFYVGNTPIATIIVGKDINLFSSDISKNEFKGFVFAKNLLFSSEVNFSGCIYANTLKSDGNLNYTNVDYLLDLMTDDLTYLLMDELGVTNFKGGSSDINDILKNIEIIGAREIELFGEFKMGNIYKTERY
ncbi:MAG: hypothetical protein ACK5LT_06575 [Lachnospirales bacterium]